MCVHVHAHVRVFVLVTIVFICILCKHIHTQTCAFEYLPLWTSTAPQVWSAYGACPERPETTCHVLHLVSNFLQAAQRSKDIV